MSKREPEIDGKPKASVGTVAVGHPIDVASGNLFHLFEDFSGPGRVPLTFGRRYNVSLLNETGGMFGAGWSSPYEMKLKRDLEGFCMIPESGEGLIEFQDRKGQVSAGAIVRNLSAFSEIECADDNYRITQWSPTGDEIIVYTFAKRDFGQWMPLIGRHRVDGNGVDISHDEQGRVSTVQLVREGRYLQLVYDGRGCVTAVWLRCPRYAVDEEMHTRPVLSFGYDNCGMLSSMTNALGKRCTYEYNESGRMVRESNLAGMVYTFEFDSQGRCVESCGTDNYGLTQLEFFEDANVTRVKNSLGDATVYTYNGSGQVIEKMTPLGNKWNTAFDEEGRISVEIKPNGATTEYTYDEQGNRAKIASPDGTVTSFEYNERHQLTTMVDPAGYAWEQSYDSRGRPETKRLPNGSNTTTRYDRLGDPLTFDSGVGGALVFDAVGNRIEENTWAGRKIRHTFDAEGYVSSKTEIDEHGQEHQTRYQRDLLGQTTVVSQVNGKTQCFSYGAYALIEKVSDDSAGETRFKYNLDGQLQAVWKSGGDSVSFRLGTEPGRVLAVVNENGEEMSFSYDAEGNVTERTEFDGTSTTFQYDAVGGLLVAESQDDKRTCYERDALGRTLKITYWDEGEVSFGYDERGLLVRAQNADCEIVRKYDALGVVCAEARDDHEVRHDLDASALARVTSSSLGYRSSAFFDEFGRVEMISAPHNAPIGFIHNAHGQEQARFVAEGVAIAQSFDQSGRIGQQRVERMGRGNRDWRRIFVRDYGYDARNNLIRCIDSRLGETNYGYDSDDQTVESKGPGNRAQNQAYDRAGNPIFLGSSSEKRSVLFANDGYAASCTIAAGNLLTRYGTTRYCYNERGDLIRKRASTGKTASEADSAATQYQWNGNGTLRSVSLPNGEVWRYEYDPMARRIRKTGPSRIVEYIWDGDVVLHEVTLPIFESADVDSKNTSPTIRTYQYDPQSFAPLALIEDGRRYLCVNDVAGNPRELVSDEGEIVWSAVYSPLGQAEIRSDADIEFSIRLQGQWYDAETGLHYNRHRYYDPSIGRYISADPAGVSGGLNRYAYGPNTTGWLDVFGLAAGPCWWDEYVRPQTLWAEYQNHHAGFEGLRKSYSWDTERFKSFANFLGRNFEKNMDPGYSGGKIGFDDNHFRRVMVRATLAFQLESLQSSLLHAPMTNLYPVRIPWFSFFRGMVSGRSSDTNMRKAKDYDWGGRFDRSIDKGVGSVSVSGHGVDSKFPKQGATAGVVFKYVDADGTEHSSRLCRDGSWVAGAKEGGDLSHIPLDTSRPLFKTSEGKKPSNLPDTFFGGDRGRLGKALVDAERKLANVEAGRKEDAPLGGPERPFTTEQSEGRLRTQEATLAAEKARPKESQRAGYIKHLEGDIGRLRKRVDRGQELQGQIAHHDRELARLENAADVDRPPNFKKTKKRVNEQLGN
jgi:RHS repeat-associated protein